MPVLSLSPTACRRLEAIRDKILYGAGTSEPFIAEEPSRQTVSLHWRKPLSIKEVNQMAPTPEVISRPGRA